ncbi:hypothetical protein HK28_05395 [Acetobacter sp. DsW_063]|nr:hypothetical protein HK28_05395 [Acetobacter sp. DsW_063]
MWVGRAVYNRLSIIPQDDCPFFSASNSRDARYSKISYSCNEVIVKHGERQCEAWPLVCVVFEEAIKIVQRTPDETYAV